MPSSGDDNPIRRWLKRAWHRAQAKQDAGILLGRILGYTIPKVRAYRAMKKGLREGVEEMERKERERHGWEEGEEPPEPWRPW